VVQNEDVAISKFTNGEIFEAFVGIDPSYITKYAILKTECQNFTDDEFARINFVTAKPKSFNEFQFFTGLSNIPARMFRYCTDLKETILPPTVKEIGDNAFYGCSSLTSIKMPSNIITVGNSAFEKCTSLKSVE
jgi:hypothetical protein